MSDIGDICDNCPMDESDCKLCPIVNPCLNCEDYDSVNGLCKSDGGCAPERRTDGEPMENRWRKVERLNYLSILRGTGILKEILTEMRLIWQSKHLNSQK